MTRQEKWILTNFIVVVLITAIAVAGMVELKNFVNRSEAMRAMQQLQEAVAQYKQKNGFLPPESYIEGIKQNFEGQLRLGHLYYRARWIGFDAKPDTVVAYVKRNYHSFFIPSGVIVLTFDGQVKWMNKADFDKLIKPQQTPLELELSPK